MIGNELEYPTTTHSFEIIRNAGAVYIDKTELLYELTKSAVNRSFFFHPPPPFRQEPTY